MKSFPRLVIGGFWELVKINISTILIIGLFVFAAILLVVLVMGFLWDVLEAVVYG
jgi:hypothetical protein